MAQREPCSPYSRHYSANSVTLSLEMVERAGLHMMCGKVSIKWLAWVVVEELGLTQFQSLPMPRSCATSAGWVAPLSAPVCRMEIKMLLSLTSVACILESALSPTFCLHGNIHSTFGSSTHTVRKRVFQCNRIIITIKQYCKSNMRYFTIRIFKIFEEKWAEGTWKS